MIIQKKFLVIKASHSISFSIVHDALCLHMHVTCKMKPVWNISSITGWNQNVTSQLVTLAELISILESNDLASSAVKIRSHLAVESTVNFFFKFFN